MPGEVVEATWEELPPQEHPASSPAPSSATSPVVLRSRPVAAPARRRATAQASAARCPVCGEVKVLVEVEVAFVVAKVCSRCATIGSLGVRALSALLR